MFRRSLPQVAALLCVFSSSLVSAQTPPALGTPPSTPTALPTASPTAPPAPLPLPAVPPPPAGTVLRPVPPSPPAIAPDAPRSPTNLSPPASPPGAVGPNAPVSKVTEALELKLAAMQRGNGLTSDEAAQRALRSNVDVTAKQKGLAAAEAQIESTEAQFLPRLTLQASYTRLNKFHQPDFTFPGGGAPVSGDQLFPVIANNYALQASLSIPLSDYVLRLSSSIAAVKHSRAAANIDERATRLAVARDARVDYYQWIRAQGASFVAQQSLEAARGHAADAKNGFDAGLVSRADVLRTLSQEKSAELTVAHWENNVAIATEQLRIAIGDKPNVDYEVGENILGDLPAYSVPADPGAAYAEALEHRLEVKQLGESEASLREQASVARAGRYPRLEARGNALYANPNSRYVPPTATWHGTWDVGVTLSWTPTDILGANAQGRYAEAQADEIAARSDSVKNGLRLEVSQAMNALAEAEFGLESSREGLAAAAENYRVRRELYRAGKATTVEVTDAETDLTRARLDVVNSHVDVRIARVTLTHALGRDVPAQ